MTQLKVDNSKILGELHKLTNLDLLQIRNKLKCILESQWYSTIESDFLIKEYSDKKLDWKLDI